MHTSNLGIMISLKNLGSWLGGLSFTSLLSLKGLFAIQHNHEYIIFLAHKVIADAWILLLIPIRQWILVYIVPTLNTVPRSECCHSTLCACDHQRINSFPHKAFQEAFPQAVGLETLPRGNFSKPHPPISKLEIKAPRKEMGHPCLPRIFFYQRTYCLHPCGCTHPSLSTWAEPISKRHCSKWHNEAGSLTMSY